MEMYDPAIEIFLSRFKNSATVKINRFILELFAAFLKSIGGVRLRDVTAGHLADYRQRLESGAYSHTTVRGHLERIRRFFNELEESGMIFVNPAENLVLPKDIRTHKPVPTEDDIKKLLIQPDLESPYGIRDRAILETAYACALRRDEIFNLGIFDADLRRNELKIKGARARAIPLSPKTAARLDAYIRHVRPGLAKDPDQTGLWVSRRTGRGLSQPRLDRLIREYGQKAGLSRPMTVRALRLAGVRHMLKNGATPEQLQHRLGYTDLNTMTRLGLTISEMRKLNASARKE